MAFYDSLMPQGDIWEILQEANKTPEQRMMKNRFTGGMKDIPADAVPTSAKAPIAPFEERAAPAMAAPPTTPPQMNFPLNTPLPQENRQAMLPPTGIAGANPQSELAATGAEGAKPGGNILGALTSAMSLMGGKSESPKPMQLMAPTPATPGRSPQAGIDPILLALAGGRLG